MNDREEKRGGLERRKKRVQVEGWVTERRELGVGDREEGEGLVGLATERREKEGGA